MREEEVHKIIFPVKSWPFFCLFSHAFIVKTALHLEQMHVRM